VLDVVDRRSFLQREHRTPQAPPRRPASAAARATPSPARARKCPRWIMRVMLITTDPSPARFDPRSTVYGEVRRTPSRAAAERSCRRYSATAPHPDRSWMSDRERAIQIRTIPDWDRTVLSTAEIGPSDPPPPRAPDRRLDRPIQIRRPPTEDTG
jgi:hypothetical protein